MRLWISLVDIIGEFCVKEPHPKAGLIGSGIMWKGIHKS
jgi:hypothetical protein